MVNNISFDYGDGRQTRNISSGEDRKVTFSLPVNKKFFNVGLDYGDMENVSSDYFSKTYIDKVASNNLFLILHF